MRHFWYLFNHCVVISFQYVGSRLILSFFSFALHNACSGDFGCLVYVMLTLNTKYFDVCLFL